MARTNRPSHLPPGWSLASGRNRDGDTVYRHDASGAEVRMRGRGAPSYEVYAPGAETPCAGLFVYLADAMAAAERGVALTAGTSTGGG